MVCLLTERLRELRDKMKSVASVPESAENDHSDPQVGSTQFETPHRTESNIAYSSTGLLLMSAQVLW